ncbi:MAG: FlgO family outer membrane protein [Pyrinomonadaceae bacterium]
MANEINEIREFDGFRFDTDTKMLWHREEPVSIPLKAAELLSLLVTRAGEVVTKEEIWQEVWGDSFVEETNLTHNIYLLRKTLKEFANSNLIETVPRRGYRFKGFVRSYPRTDLVVEKFTSEKTLIEIDHETHSRQIFPKSLRKLAESRPWIMVSVVAGCIVAVLGATFLVRQTVFGNTPSEINSVAVVPFSVIADENLNDGRGLADLLITRLGSTKHLTVRPFSAVANLLPGDPGLIGQKLDVDAVLEGTLFRSGKDVRVTARLVRTSDKSVVWTGEFEKAADEDLTIQKDIALQIVNSLSIQLDPSERSRMTKDFSKSREAYRLYSEGRYRWNDRNFEGIKDAERLFTMAISEDPKFALAYSGLADAQCLKGDFTGAQYAVLKALEIDPQLSEAHSSYGLQLMFVGWKWDEAEKEFEKAIKLNPNNLSAWQWLGTLNEIRGRNAKALEALNRALEINPNSYNILTDLAEAHYFARDYTLAEKYARRSLEIKPDFQFTFNTLFSVYAMKGDEDRAFEAAFTAQRINGSHLSKIKPTGGGMDKMLANWETMFRTKGWEAFLRSQIDAKSIDPAVHLRSAIFCAYLKKNDEALDYLELAYKGRPFLFPFFNANPAFDDIRGHPRFQKIREKMKL